MSPEPTPVVLDPDVRCLAGGRVLLGGDPGRLVRLRTPLDGLVPGAVLPPAAHSLAATLVAGGLGQLLTTGRELLDVPQVMAVMGAIILIGVATDRLLFQTVEARVRRRWGLVAPT